MIPILLHPNDNVLVLGATVRAGETFEVEGRPVVARSEIPAGHKVVRLALAAGDKVVKYGAVIGSATEAAAVGDHLHLHNMKSDYIPSHTRKATETAP